MRIQQEVKENHILEKRFHLPRLYLRLSLRGPFYLQSGEPAILVDGYARRLSGFALTIDILYGSALIPLFGSARSLLRIVAYPEFSLNKLRDRFATRLLYSYSMHLTKYRGNTSKIELCKRPVRRGFLHLGVLQPYGDDWNTFFAAYRLWCGLHHCARFD